MAHSAKKPAYLLHAATGQARCRINRKDHYLGKYGSAESRERYNELIRQWRAGQTGEADGGSRTVDELALDFIAHAEQHYRKNGVPTSEVHCVKLALQHLIKVHGKTRVRDFGTKALKDVRESMIAQGWARKSINNHIGRIMRVFDWGVSEETVPGEVAYRLRKLPGLEPGRSAARETEPVGPVPAARIDAIRPYVSRQVWGAVQVQLLCAMRPGEVLSMRGRDLNMSGRIWEYTPASHKTEHHQRQRIIFIGPKGQSVLREFLRTNLDEYLFQPAESRAESDAKRTENRQTPLTPSQRSRTRLTNPKKKPGQRYNVTSYGQAIRKACERAFDMPDELLNVSNSVPEPLRSVLREQARAWRAEHCWHPHQLRHTGATIIRREAGLEVTSHVLGHASVVTSEIYAQPNVDAARAVILKVG